MVIARRGHGVPHRHVFHSPDAPQHAFHLLPLGQPLFHRRKVLVAASPAPAKVRATRLHPFRRGIFYGDQPRFQVVAVFPDNFDLRRLPHRHERHEDHPSVLQPPDTLPAKGDFVDDNFHAENVLNNKKGRLKRAIPTLLTRPPITRQPSNRKNQRT